VDLVAKGGLRPFLKDQILNEVVYVWVSTKGNGYFDRGVSV